MIRLDGGTAVSKRQKLVDQLNDLKRDEFVFLLSSKVMRHAVDTGILYPSCTVQNASMTNILFHGRCFDENVALLQPSALQ